jgi:hypothetical protein
MAHCRRGWLMTPCSPRTYGAPYRRSRRPFTPYRNSMRGVRPSGQWVELDAQIRSKFRGVSRPPAATLEHRALLDGERHVMNVALDVR